MNDEKELHCNKYIKFLKKKKKIKRRNLFLTFVTFCHISSQCNFKFAPSLSSSLGLDLAFGRATS